MLPSEVCAAQISFLMNAAAYRTQTGLLRVNVRTCTRLSMHSMGYGTGHATRAEAWRDSQCFLLCLGLFVFCSLQQTVDICSGRHVFVPIAIFIQMG